MEQSQRQAAQSGRHAVRQSWQRTWRAIGGRGEGAVDEGSGLMERLLSAYAEPQRRYHTLQHLGECLQSLGAVLHLADHPGELEMAVWFHDAIYDVRAHDNELRSARWAEQAMQEAQVPVPARERLHDLVMATRHSAMPQTTDEKLLVDVDLSILGASQLRFDEYEAQVRQEYSWVPSWMFRRKRRQILESLLARDALYSTPLLRDALEKNARDNLRRALSKLKPWYQA